MANRKSWRRAVAPASGQTRSTPASATMRSHKSAQNGTTFPGVEDSSLTSMLALVHAKDVTLREANGAEYTGLFSGMERPPKSEPHVVLLYARNVRSASSGASSAILQEVRKSTARKLLIPLSRVLHVTASAKDIEVLKSHTADDARVGNKGAFATDAEISRGTAGAGRQLQRFDDFTDFSNPIGMGSGAQTLDEETFGDLAASNGATGKKWDQFQVNEDKFGVKTSFDEDEYTTKIDRHDVKYAERQREAARLASEIENKSSSNVHMRQERNQEIGADYDEESLHSGVQRPALSESGAKTTPAQVTENSRDVKPAPPEKPRLSYAAAAASSMKASPVATNSNAQNTNPSGKPAMMAKGPVPRSNSASKQAMQPKANTSAKQPQASRQSQTSKQMPAPKQTATPKQAPVTKPIPPKQNSVRQPQTPKGTSSTKAGNTQGGGQGSKQGQSARQSMPNATTTSGTNVNVAKQAAQSPTTSSSGTENKERDTMEKKSKVSGPRERSSRDNLPQLVKVMTSIKGRTSPNQSRNSPLPIHATADTSAVAVLNLDAQTPNLGADKIKRFEEFKTNREIRSIAENREKITDDLKKFRTQLDSRNGQLRRSLSSTGSNGNSSSTVTVTEKKNVETSLKSEEKTESVNKTTEQKVDDNKDGENSSSAGSDTSTKPKPKLKSKLNPNAQEFKFNPDAPTFKPAAQKGAPVTQAPQNFNPYAVNAVPAEYSQPMQAPHQAYPVPMQAMGQISYGQPPYGIIAPGGVPVGVAPGNSAYQFIQAPPSSFPASQVPARFPQGAAVPASYPYPQMNPTMPMVMAQAPQRIPASPYAYYNAGPYGTGQVPGSPQIPPSPQQAVYAASSQPGLPHLQGGASISGRGGHGHARRSGGGRRGGKHQGSQQSHNMQEASGILPEKMTPRTEGTVTTDTSQR